MIKYYDMAIAIITGRLAKEPVDYGIKNTPKGKRKLIKFPVIVNMEKSSIIINVEWWIIPPYNIIVNKGDRISFMGTIGQFKTKNRTYQKITITKLIAINKFGKSNIKIADEEDINAAINDDFYKTIYGGNYE